MSTTIILHLRITNQKGTQPTIFTAMKAAQFTQQLEALYTNIVAATEAAIAGATTETGRARLVSAFSYEQEFKGSEDEQLVVLGFEMRRRAKNEAEPHVVYQNLNTGDICSDRPSACRFLLLELLAQIEAGAFEAMKTDEQYEGGYC